MKTVVRRAVLLLLLLSAGARAAHAQAFSRLESGEQAVTAETGLESAIITSLVTPPACGPEPRHVDTNVIHSCDASIRRRPRED